MSLFNVGSCSLQLPEPWLFFVDDTPCLLQDLTRFPTVRLLVMSVKHTQIEEGLSEGRTTSRRTQSALFIFLSI